MQRLVGYAISIDEVRDIFRAPEPLAQRLRGVAAERFSQPQPPRRSWFGPLVRRDPATEVNAALPMRGDVDAMLTGAFIAPERMPQSWQLFHVWLEDLSAAHRSVAWDAEAFGRVEWDLARCGLASDYALSSLADRQLGIPLRPAPGQLVGYAKRVHAVEALSEYRRVLEATDLTEESRAWVEPVAELLAVVAAGEGLDVALVGVPEQN